MRLSFLSLAAPLALAAMAAPAAADTYHVTSMGMFSPGQVKLTGQGAGTYRAGPYRLVGTTSGSPFDFLAFCADLAHTVSPGINKMKSVNYTYVASPLVTDGYGNPLSASQKQQMMGLARLGRSISRDRGLDAQVKAKQLAAIQGAIWLVEHPGATLHSASGFPGLKTEILRFVNLAPGLSGHAMFLASVDNPQRQNLVAAVPEPGTWAMMIAGFGLVGATARRRRERLERPLALA